MKEIINAIKEWNAIRTNSNALNKLFYNVQGFYLDMRLFPAGEPLHAYAAVKNNELYFIVISEKNDVRKDANILEKECVWIPCTSSLSDDQQISEREAKERIQTWKDDANKWINQVTKTATGIYQTFFIPTTDLKPEKYHVFFALKDDALTPNIKAADLVLKSNANLYFDTVKNQPPYRDQTKYYVLDLL